MSKKYGLTKHEQDLLTKALKYQEKAEAIHRKNAAFQMGLVPCWALTVLIDSKQIEKCDCFAERK